MGTILVTGGSRGIGRGIALALADAGHRVAVHYNGNREAALEVAEECRRRYESAPHTPPDRDASSGGAERSPVVAQVFQANLAESADRERLVREVHESMGELDGLVNNAGIAPRRRDDIVYASEEIFDEVMRVNLYGPYFLTQLVARRWLEKAGSTAASNSATEVGSTAAPGSTAARAAPAASGAHDNAPAARGRVVFVTSISATTVSASRGEYCVSKAGMAMGAQLFAARLAGEGILTFEIRPGITATDMTAGVTEKYDRLIAEGLVPQGRWGQPRDTGEVVRAIMDGRMDFAPGSVVYTDGGLHIPRL